MSALESMRTVQLAERARKITARELREYVKRTAASQKATERAKRVMPLGVPSSFQSYDPHPLGFF